MNAYYTVTHQKTGKVTTYTTLRQASRAADRMDLAYGAVITSIRPHYRENTK